MPVIKKTINPPPPNLPLGTEKYERRYIDQLNNVLRLYFNQLSNALATLFDTNGGGSILSFPYFSAYQDGETTLTAAIPNSTSTAAIQVGSTSNFLDAGYIIIQEEIIQYTGKTATTFTGITRGVLGTNSGKASHAIGQYVTEAAGVTSTTSAPMYIDVVTASSQITCTPPSSEIHFAVAGMYNIQFSAQLLNYSTSIDNVRIWLVKNGNIMAYSGGFVEIQAKHGSTPGAVIAGWNYVEQMNAGDYIQIYWRSVTGETVVATFPQGTSPTRPTSPGLIVTATFVSALPT